uniref:Copper transporter n=1 Tax=Panagrellus redivivus TaxID=6233 RepID=A0A7E4VDT1_PANRE
MSKMDIMLFRLFLGGFIGWILGFCMTYAFELLLYDRQQWRIARLRPPRLRRRNNAFYSNSDIFFNRAGI